MRTGLLEIKDIVQIKETLELLEAKVIRAQVELERTNDESLSYFLFRRDKNDLEIGIRTLNRILTVF